MLLKVDEFVFMVNNVIYVVVGELFGYWDFFLVEEGWGCIFVWGFVDVIVLIVEGLVVGECFYGYLFMLIYLLIEFGYMIKYFLMDMVVYC